MKLVQFETSPMIGLGATEPRRRIYIDPAHVIALSPDDASMAGGMERTAVRVVDGGTLVVIGSIDRVRDRLTANA